MKQPILRIWLLAPLAVLFTTMPAAAADIDIYSGVAGSGGEPNVLFFIDNTSNWSASNQAWNKADVTAKCNLLQDPAKTTCYGYVTQIFGSNTKLTQGQVELRALRLVLNELVCKTGAKIKVNAGIMLLSKSGSADGSSVNSGYIRHRIAPLDSTQCGVVLADLDNIDSKITDPAFNGPSNAEYGTALYEAFKYFGGWTNPAGSLTATAGSPTGATGFGPIRYSALPIDQEDPKAFTDSSKTTYLSPIAGTAVCGKNYIVLIGNTWPNSEYGTDTNASPNPTNKLMTRLNYNPGPQIYPKPLASSDKTDVRFADEWAKFLYKTDVSDVTGAQNVSMFTVDVYNKTADPKQGALLKSMADQSGPNGYFPVDGDLYGLINAFIDIMTQVAAVDSVFASASLPVSVNAQGTFLNQVFMGVFRPDDNAQQRWVGNLKQYQFALNGNTLFLADATGKSAVDAVNSGFIQHCAQSFWTKDSGTYWQSITGMNNPSACDPVNNLKPYSDLPDGPIVERGGAGQRLRDLGYAARNIQTCSTSGCTALTDFTTTNMTSLSPTLVNWARGQNNGDGYIKASTGAVTYIDYGLGGLGDSSTANTVTRPTVHGEVVHSRPLAVNYGVNNANDVVVFYGAGDGMLHAVNGNQATTDGNELWSFIAPEHWSTLDRVRTNSPLISYPNVSTGLTPTPTPKTYFFDGTIGGYQERTSSSVSKLWIYPTMRRGGRSVYAFDVTSKPSASVQPKLLWRYSETNDSRMGETWSTPVAIRVKGMNSPLVVFGAGYDKCDDAEDSNTACASVTQGKGIVVMDAEKGSAANYRFIGLATGELDSTAGRFVADMTAVDVDRDGYVDVLYAVDTRGNIWRINTSDPSTSYTGYSDVSKWPVNKIAQVSDWSTASEKRKFMYSPSVVMLGSQATVLVGTGDREKPSATSTAAQVNNRFYGIRDDVTKTSAADITVAKGYGVVIDPADLPDLKNVTTLSTFNPTDLLSFKGWFRNLSTTSAPYEQVITTPLTFAGVTYFNTYQAKASGSNMCANLGTGRAYQIDFQTGTKLNNLDLVTTFITEGIPPSPVGGLVVVDGKTVPFLIGGPGPTPLSPKKVVPQVRPDRKPAYRYHRIDK